MTLQLPYVRRKLNLGCGDDIRPGYINVDFRRIPGVDRVVDLSHFPWPFDDSSFDEILMLDFLEHFPYALTEQILIECHRVLMPGGSLEVQVPDGDHLMKALVQSGHYLCNRCGGCMEEDFGPNRLPLPLKSCPKCRQSADDISEAAMRRLYGGQDFVGNYHQTVFTKRSLSLKASRCGFLREPEYQEESHQLLNWNFKARFVKGDLW